MNEFRVDPHLYEALKRIRQEVRAAFEQLRLRHSDGDISGKDRLERVPALAKRNFAQLVSGDNQRALREAWRLVDFLEGQEGARLTPIAREALRPVELDAQLTRLRESQRWRETAMSLREALGAACPDAQAPRAFPQDTHEPDQTPPAAPGAETPDEPPEGETPDADETKAASPPRPDRSRRLVGAVIGLAVVGAVAVAILTWRHRHQPDPRYACIPLERATQSELAAHWAVVPSVTLPLPPPDSARPNPRVVTISDLAGSPVRSVFTTSQYSYEEGPSPTEAGGGMVDVRLRVGGWGDTYLSLLKVPLPDNRIVRRAVIRLVVLGDEPISRPTSIVLRNVSDHWDVTPSPQHRLWWRDCPRSSVVRRNLPPPGPPESSYDIDITPIYNLWTRGMAPNQGIMLEPEHIGSYGRTTEHYSNFSTFYSTRAIEPEKRPKLILYY